MLVQTLVTCKQQHAPSSSSYANCVAVAMLASSARARAAQDNLSQFAAQVSTSCANQIVTLSGPLGGWSR